MKSEKYTFYDIEFNQKHVYRTEKESDQLPDAQHHDLYRIDFAAHPGYGLHS